LNFPPSVLQHLRCNCFYRSNNSELQFIEGDHTGLLNNVVNVSSQKEYRVSVEATKLVHHAQPSAQENACQEILGTVLLLLPISKITYHGNPDNNLESYYITFPITARSLMCTVLALKLHNIYKGVHDLLQHGIPRLLSFVCLLYDLKYAPALNFSAKHIVRTAEHCRLE
jgi:hypothetical protein